MLRKISIVMFIVSALVCLVAGFSVMDNPAIEKMYFTTTEKTLSINSYFSLDVEYQPQNSRVSKLLLKWSSSDEDVVTVDDKGLVTAVGVGVADIFAEYQKTTLKCSVTVVPVDVVSVSISSVYDVIHPMETMQMTSTISPDNATYQNLTWTSSNEGVATVNANGVVTGVAEGETTIKATSVNGVVATRNIKVRNTIEVEDLELSINVSNPSWLWLSTYNLTATFYPNNADDKALLWSSSNPEVMSVENGVVTTKKDGSATITATATNGVSATINLNVPRVEAENVVIKAPNGGNAVSYTMSVGQQVQLSVSLTRSIEMYPYITSQGITTTELIWSSSNPAVQIDENGLVTALATTDVFGIQITVTVKGVGISDTYIIIVTE